MSNMITCHTFVRTESRKGTYFSLLQMAAMQRLRTENRLLRQRIDMLEAESSELADRLIQVRVILGEGVTEGLKITFK